MRFLCSIILASAIMSCGVTKKESSSSECSLKSAIEKAKERVNRKGFQLDKYNVSYAMHEKVYLIVFSTIDIIAGGGAEITISKENCEIVDAKYYQ